MAIQITNSLTRNKETFSPLKPGEVSLYVCGPTVYHYIHIGNARPYVFFDVVRRFLERSGFTVNHVMNYTDVDDKIIDRAAKENTNCTILTERYIAAFVEDMASLGVKPPKVTPRVTEHIPQILALIQRLIDNESAYVVDGEVFFAVRSFSSYGKLSGKNIDDLIVGARVEPDAKKRDPVDFSLWKPRKSDKEPSWDSPWGKGRPGWHIECSAMAMQYLGETFDIHGGGMDLIHPHHENEIAQSEAATRRPYVFTWMHNNMLTMHAQKMSKSLGNILLAREFIRIYGAETLKFLLLSGHYRSLIDFSDKHIRESQGSLHRIYSVIHKCETVIARQDLKKTSVVSTESNRVADIGKDFGSRWTECMEDDFNTARAVGVLFEYVRAMNAYLDRKGFQPDENTRQLAAQFLSNVKELSLVFNLFQEPSRQMLEQLKDLILKERGIDRKEIEKEIKRRQTARQNKDFATADQIRQALLAKGIDLQDLGSQTEWNVVFAEASAT
jgi:cysteinyl-tRNA synthetase